MSDPRVTYLGPDSQPATVTARRRPQDVLGRIPYAFLIVVGLPTLVAAIYFLLIATPRFVSEARFIVRAPSQQQPSSLGVALQGVGVSGNSTDSFAVHEYIESRDALIDLERRFNLAEILARPGVDPFSRYPSVGQGSSNEGLYKSFNRFVTVGYEASTGISTLRVEAFRADDAQALAQALLDGGEALVNRLNDRSAARAVSDAERSVLEAEQRLNEIQLRLSTYRNSQGILDPASAAEEGSSLIGELLSTIATLRAERAQVVSQAPQSPTLPLLDSRIAAFERQLEIERGKLTGAASSLATKISGYEALVLERTLADRALAAASTELDGTRNDARRQKLYLERVVNPGLPDKASQPRRWMGVLSVFISSLLIYAVGWLVWAGLREHRQL